MSLQVGCREAEPCMIHLSMGVFPIIRSIIVLVGRLASHLSWEMRTLYAIVDIELYMLPVIFSLYLSVLEEIGGGARGGIIGFSKEKFLTLFPPLNSLL